MKEKGLTLLSVLMVLFPWTLLLLRRYTKWALVYAHILIPGYAVVMILYAVCAFLIWHTARVRNSVMGLCLLIHGIYGAFGVMVLAMMLNG